MKPTIYILCANVQEAELIATRFKLGRGDWKPITGPETLRGLRNAHVYRTPCWFYGRPEQVTPIWEQLRASQAVMRVVHCTTHSPARYAEDAA